jgi:cell wall-associated NlpC family hydrolase
VTRAYAPRRKHALFVPLFVTLALVSGGLVDSSPAAAANPNLGEVQAKITAITAQLDKANEQYNTANVQLGKVRTQQAAIGKQLAATRVQVSALRKQAGSYAAQAYKGGDMNALGSISMLSSGSASQFLDQLTTLDALTNKAEAPLRALQAVQAVQAAQNAKLTTLATAASTLVATLTSSKASFNAQLQPLLKLQAQMTPVYSDNSYHATAPPGSLPSVAFAYAQLSEPYVFGAAGPSSWDCSGLTEMAYQQIGKSLEHSAHLQYQALRHVSQSSVQAGDLVFFYGFEHVGIAISRTQVIHAPQPGDSVKITNIGDMPFAGAARP